MKISFPKTTARMSASAVLVGMFPGRRPAPGSTGFVRGHAATLESLGFEGAKGQTAVISGGEGRLVVCVGLGEELDLEGLRQAAGLARKAVPAVDVIATTLHRVGLDGADQAVVEGVGLADYRFDTYKSAAVARSELVLELIGGTPSEKVTEVASIVVDAVNRCRDLVNEPAAAKSPETIAARLADHAASSRVSAEVWSLERLVAERMGGIIGVGQGSIRPPALLVLRYTPRRARARLALVGKGIVFDSGGLSLKPADAMEAMKDDMAGGAAVALALVAIARLGLPVEVVSYSAFAENMPGGAAQRPGDVLTARNGKTIEVLNTDAEGRLVLADALSLAAESSPDLIVDLATLTGSCKIALGPRIAGVFGNEQTAIDRVLTSGESAGERLWPLPMPSDHRPMIDSEIADMKNTGQGRYGGAIAAALLLAEFVGDIPWVHLDIAGPAYLDKGEHYIPKGGTGFGVRTLIELARSLS